MLSGQYGLDNVLMSLPTVVGKQGAEKVLMHPFSDEELSTLARIAENVTAVVNEVAQVTGLKA